jgi:hypothetical protein
MFPLGFPGASVLVFPCSQWVFPGAIFRVFPVVPMFPGNMTLRGSEECPDMYGRVGSVRDPAMHRRRKHVLKDVVDRRAR